VYKREYNRPGEAYLVYFSYLKSYSGAKCHFLYLTYLYLFICVYSHREQYNIYNNNKSSNNNNNNPKTGRMEEQQGDRARARGQSDHVSSHLF